MNDSGRLRHDIFNLHPILWHGSNLESFAVRNSLSMYLKSDETAIHKNSKLFSIIEKRQRNLVFVFYLKKLFLLGAF